jgi:hypothetical protein
VNHWLMAGVDRLRSGEGSAAPSVLEAGSPAACFARARATRAVAHFEVTPTGTLMAPAASGRRRSVWAWHGGQSGNSGAVFRLKRDQLP